MPSHEAIRRNRHIARLGPRVQHHNLWHFHRRSVAGGVAAGMFAGLVPGSNPVQFTFAAVLAVIFRVNLPVAVLVTLYSNPFTIVPLYFVALKLGQVILFEQNGGVPPLALELQGKGFREWIPAVLDWLTSVGKPLLVGLPVLAVILAVVGYFAVDWAWKLHVCYSWRRRRRLRAVRNASRS